ncbi:MAG TPA: glycosyltransferase [Geminicoccus sp.]|uniref:glycosyltransferase n=1 Tax=Geminicoccus sp. TaxID=2024832 RepID=UPI002E2FF2F0|nr:glycosyltransferase [Geminicoccus sp.]HEX2526682.1 glycosyltransferase [Geminicoccus sp.]
MSVGIFLPSLEGGGAERAMLNLAKGIREAGHEVDLVVASGLGPYRDEVEGGVRFVDLGARRTLSALPALVRYLRLRRPRVLFSALDHANLVALLAGRLSGTGVEVVPGLRNTRSEEISARADFKERIILALSRPMYAAARHLVAVSAGVAKDACGLLGLRPDQVVVIPNPVLTPDLDRLASARISHPWFADGAPPVILACGRLTGQKDYVTLVRAFARLRREQDVRLLILGEGEDRSVIEALAADLGIAGSVSLPGFDPNPFRYMARCDLFVLSSRFEGSPNVLVQALACGAPVVATDCPSGPREILEDEAATCLVPVGDVAGLADAMARALRSGRAGCVATRLARFDYRTAAAAYLSLLP